MSREDQTLMRKKADTLQGTLDLLILKTLASRGPMHGYAIAVHIETTSDDVLRVEEGSLYPALHRLEQAGMIRADWRSSENNRRARYYGITPAGSKQLASEQRAWRLVVSAVERVLQLT